MSLIGDAAANFALINVDGRNIGGIIPDVVVEEMHHDAAVMTVHPVETGTPISDHMFFLPKTVEMRPGWSDSSPDGGPGFSRQVYEQLLALQKTRKPFTLITGKRKYENMQIRDLAVKTDEESENSLLAVVVMQEIVFATVTTTAATPDNTNGSSGVGNATTADKTPEKATSADIASANAKAAGWSTDGNGNVAFPNSTVPTGTVQPNGLGVTGAPGWGTLPNAYTPTAPADTSVVGHH